MQAVIEHSNPPRERLTKRKILDRCKFRRSYVALPCTEPIRTEAKAKSVAASIYSTRNDDHESPHHQTSTDRGHDGAQPALGLTEANLVASGLRRPIDDRTATDAAVSKALPEPSEVSRPL